MGVLQRRALPHRPLLMPESEGGWTGSQRGRVSWCQLPSLLFLLLQVELKTGKGAGERAGPDWKAALQREREEQQHLLAESYSAVMELTRQLQISERNWSQEKLQLVERLQGEKQQVEQQVKELQNRLSQVRPAPATMGTHCGRSPGLGSPSVIAGSRCSEKAIGATSASLPISQACSPLCFIHKPKLSSNMVTILCSYHPSLAMVIESFPFPQG